MQNKSMHRITTEMIMAAEDTITTCANCGKEGGNLNTCNKCKMVKYCNAACKKKHRSKHKKACEKRVAELHDEALFKEHPPRDDCPICFLPLPLDADEMTFKSCCGKIICDGCIFAMVEEAHGRGGEVGLCAFCRVPAPDSDEGVMKRLNKLIEADHPYAFDTLAGYYDMGTMGMPQDMAKANELFFRAGELGWGEAYCTLGFNYINGRGVEMDEKKAKHYWELAAMNGNVGARHNLGCMEGEAGNHDRAKKHFILAAKAGFKKSLDNVKGGYIHGFVTRDEYANTLRAYQQRHDEMKSDNRDKARAARNGR